MILNNCWSQHIENPQILKAIFGNSIPDLSAAKLTSITSVFWRREIEINLLLDILPEPMPKKWVDKGVNTILCEMSFSDVTYEHVSTPLVLSGNTSSMRISILYVNDLFKVSIVNDENKEIFRFDSVFLRVNLIGVRI